MQHLDLRTERAKRGGRGPECSTISTVDDHVHAVDPTALEGLGEVRDVVVERTAVLGRDPHTSPFRTGLRHRLRQHGKLFLDACFERFGDLPAARREELDAVVHVGIVTGRNHCRGRGALVGEMRDTRSREHTRKHDIGAFGADSCNQCRFEHRPGTACVTADDVWLLGAEDAYHRAPERGDELGSELGVRNSTHAVRAETESHGDAIADGRLSAVVLIASSIAVPFGPS